MMLRWLRAIAIFVLSSGDAIAQNPAPTLKSPALVVTFAVEVDSEKLDQMAVTGCIRDLKFRVVVCSNAACEELSPNLDAKLVFSGSRSRGGVSVRTADALVPGSWESISYVFTDPITGKTYVLPATEATPDGKVRLRPAFSFENDRRVQRDPALSVPGHDGWAVTALRLSTEASLGVPAPFGVMLRQRFAECRAKAQARRIVSASNDNDTSALLAALDNTRELKTTIASNAELFAVARTKVSGELHSLPKVSAAVTREDTYRLAERRSQLKVLLTGLDHEIARSKALDRQYEQILRHYTARGAQPLQNAP